MFWSILIKFDHFWSVPHPCCKQTNKSCCLFTSEWKFINSLWFFWRSYKNLLIFFRVPFNFVLVNKYLRMLHFFNCSVLCMNCLMEMLPINKVWVNFCKFCSTAYSWNFQSENICNSFIYLVDFWILLKKLS